MEQLLEFFNNHLILSTAFLAIIFLLLIDLFGAGLRGFKAASPTEATQLINHEDAVVLDIRDDNEFYSGHIVNSIHVPLGFLKDRIPELEEHKAKPIIVGCRSGSRSAKACSVLKKQGFESVYNLKGGMMAWQHANLPLTKG